jgi:hypothetical protein
MSSTMRPIRPAPLFTASAIAAGLLALSALGGCSIMDSIRPGSKASTEKGAVDTASAEAGGIDVRRYIGPDYCPELRIYDGAELIRTYQRGHQGDQNFVVWQASFGKTARECLYDLEGNVTIKIGVSGRVVAGPKGDQDAITLPIKVAIVKFKESVLATEKFSVDSAIPGRGSTVFTQVKEITVPSPGRARDYLIYVGFDVGGWDPMVPPGTGAAIAAIDEPLVEEEPPPPPVAAAPKPKKSNELPTPSGGFVLSQ